MKSRRQQMFEETMLRHKRQKVQHYRPEAFEAKKRKERMLNTKLKDSFSKTDFLSSDVERGDKLSPPCVQENFLSEEGKEGVDLLAHLKECVRTSSAPAWIVQNNVIVLGNEAIRTSLGLSKLDKFAGQPTDVLVGEGTDLAVVASVESFARKLKPTRSKLLFYSKTNVPVLLSITAIPIKPDLVVYYATFCGDERNRDDELQDCVAAEKMKVSVEPSQSVTPIEMDETRAPAITGSLFNEQSQIALTMIKLALASRKPTCLMDGTVVIEANQRWMDAFSVTHPSQIIGHTLRKIQGELTEKNIVDKLVETVFNGKTFRGWITNYRLDGSPVPQDTCITPIGGTAFLVTVHSVISLVDILANTEYGQSCMLIQNGKIIDVNAQWAFQYKFDREEALGKSPSIIFGPRTAQYIVSMLCDKSSQPKQERNAVVGTWNTYSKYGARYGCLSSFLPFGRSTVAVVTEFVPAEARGDEAKQHPSPPLEGGDDSLSSKVGCVSSDDDFDDWYDRYHFEQHGPKTER